MKEHAMKMTRALARWLTATLLGASLWAAAPLGQYVLVNEVVVRDTQSGLTWQRGTSGTRLAWAATGTYCSTLSLNGFSSGWRLPTKFELETLVDVAVSSPAAAIDPIFSGAPADGFWTSTSDSGVSGAAWVVRFDGGASRSVTKTDGFWVRCVR